MKKIICALSLLISPIIAVAESSQPKLIVQIVVDQLRGDLIYQYKDEFGTDGFNYLLNHAIDFHNAHHPHANTTTCAGHATIATGSYPSLHGIVNNDWFDRKSKKMMYCMEDLSTNILPSIHTKIMIPGRSPANLKSSTISDELILAKRGRVFGVSLKDRSAITLAGHAGKAFWFDKTNGGFVTSSYYYPAYPAWVDQWNKVYVPQSFDWSLSRPLSSYKNANTTPLNINYGTFGKSFPHHVALPVSEEYFKALSRTPKADQLTVDFANQILIQEKLGISSNQTDYLGISFSGVDAIGHQFGPNSLEAEENLIQLDKTIANLLAIIDKQIGLNNTLIVLSADHGISDTPSYLRANHIAEVEPVDIKATEQNIQDLLSHQYNLPKETLMMIDLPFVYLDHQIIRDHKLNVQMISQKLADLLTQQPGIFKAYTLPVSTIEKDWLSAKVDRMAYPDRSGDVYLVQPQFQSHGDKKEDRVAHGSPWQYDSYVPLLFVHPTFSQHLISRPVYTTDIAPTLAALLLIKSPSASVGKPLPEVLRAFNNRPSLNLTKHSAR